VTARTARKATTGDGKGGGRGRAGDAPALATAPDDSLDRNAARRARNWRRVGIALVAGVVALALTGLLGSRTATVRAAGGGYRLAVTYPQVARPGLDVRWNVEVTNPAGFGRSLSVAMSEHYFDLFDLNALRPDADSVTSTGGSVVYTWQSPPGTRFVFSLDAYAEYGEHFGLDGFSSVLVAGRPAATVTYHTRWVP
jgi:hypothetical protein